MINKIINTLMKESSLANKKNEIPVGCVITYNDKIISKAHNKKMKENNCLAHAEIIAISKATKKIKDWRLNNCTLYVTLKPCKMCYEVIKQSRITKVYYLLDSNYTNDDNRKIRMNEIEGQEITKTEYKKQLTSFFKNKR